jgi:hypothetical protein
MATLIPRLLWSVLLLTTLCMVRPGLHAAEMMAVGSAGVVDVADATKVVTDDISITLVLAPAGRQTATVRYATGSIPPLTTENGEWKLTVRYQDGDPVGAQTQRILVRLQELNMSTGDIATVATFDSDVRLITDPEAAELGWQVRTVTACHIPNPSAAYFLEATLASDAQPFAPIVHLGGMTVRIRQLGDVVPCVPGLE